MREIEDLQAEKNELAAGWIKADETIAAQQAEIARLKARVLPEGYIAAPACEWHDQVQLEARLEALREAARAVLQGSANFDGAVICDPQAIQGLIDALPTPGEAE